MTNTRNEKDELSLRFTVARIVLAEEEEEEEEEEARIVVSLLDVTERKRAENQLKTSHEQLRALAARVTSAREEEAALLAREIHDELGQALTGLKMDLSWFASSMDQDPRALKQKVDSMSLNFDATIDRVRNIATRLRPKMLDELGLIAAIEWQAQEFPKHAGVNCEVVSSVDTDEGKLPHESLSDREFEVLRMIASGRTLSQIADELFLSPNTIGTYRSRLLEKLNLRTTAELILYAAINRLID